MRQQISKDNFLSECRKISARVAAVPQLLEANTILSYWPKLDAYELDLRPLNCWMRARGCTVLLPIIEPNSGVSRMHMGQFDHERSFISNRWGILEPQEHMAISSKKIDVVLVPGLGFDKIGHRIGYGGGFYDTLLKDIDAFKLGLVMDSCLVDMIPVQPHDVPVDCIVTSTKLLSFTNTNA